MGKDLKQTQAELDELEKKLIENSKTRQKLREEAIKLKGEYFKVQTIREQQLKEELTSKKGDK